MNTSDVILWADFRVDVIASYITDAYAKCFVRPIPVDFTTAIEYCVTLWYWVVIYSYL